MITAKFYEYHDQICIDIDGDSEELHDFNAVLKKTLQDELLKFSDSCGGICESTDSLYIKVTPYDDEARADINRLLNVYINIYTELEEQYPEYIKFE